MKARNKLRITGYFLLLLLALLASALAAIQEHETAVFPSETHN